MVSELDLPEVCRASQTDGKQGLIDPSTKGIGPGASAEETAWLERFYTTGIANPNPPTADMIASGQ